MTQQPRNKARRGRLFPELTISPEDQAREDAENKAFRQRCFPIFERLRPELIEKYPDWFVTIEPDSEEYFIDRDRMSALMKAREKYPNALFFTFGINKTGVSGKI